MNNLAAMLKKLGAAVIKVAWILVQAAVAIYLITTVWDWVLPYSQEEINNAKQVLHGYSRLKGKDLAFLDQHAQEIATASNIHEIEAIRAFTVIALKYDDTNLIRNANLRETVVMAAINLGKATETPQPEAAEALIHALTLFGAGPGQAWRFANILIANAQEVPLKDISGSLGEVKKIDENAGITFAGVNALIQILAQDNLFTFHAGFGIEKLLSTLMTGPENTNPAKVGLSQALKNLKAQKLSYKELEALFRDDTPDGYGYTDTVIAILRHAHTFDALVKKLRQEADRLEREQTKKN